MKTIILLILILTASVFAKNAVIPDSTISELKYFKILVTTSDDEMFSVLQDEMYIDPKLKSYTIYVDIRSDEPKEQKLYLGDMNDPSAVKFSWKQFSDKMKAFLIAWSKPNKMAVE